MGIGFFNMYVYDLQCCQVCTFNLTSFFRLLSNWKKIKINIIPGGRLSAPEAAPVRGEARRTGKSTGIPVGPSRPPVYDVGTLFESHKLDLYIFGGKLDMAPHACCVSYQKNVV